MNQRTNQAGIDLIKRYEGFSATPYYCPAGKLTIGYGHVILPKENYVKLTKNEGDTLLSLDLVRFEKCINESVHADINDNQFSALVAFTFNLGESAFLGSTLRKMINSNYSKWDVAPQFLRWNKITDPDTGEKVPSIGVTRRREAERDLFLS